ncbi:efflux RND transporter periplasmic adaptor subunit [Vibrio campbellii]|uniref:efflux RND transporter periplasmic adaptor subunit n=1 Tax=Vibrio campbellii TaxID=680 RepID=UPI00249BCE85|nr:efflux RND transporter periplasmic adaptor subunit [Vibrio campbellii]
MTISFFTIAASAEANELLGRVEALDRVSIVAEVSGVIDKLLLQVGEPVEQNQEIALIKETDFKLNLSMSEESLILTEANYSLHKSNFERSKKLIDNNSISNSELELSHTELLRSQASLAIARIKYERSKQALNDTKIASPISGYISRKVVDSGAWVDEGDLIYEVVNIDRVTVVLMASEHDLTHLRVGQEIVIWSEVEPNIKLTSTVHRIGSDMDLNSQTYSVFVDIENSNSSYKPGMSMYASTNFSQIIDDQ